MNKILLGFMTIGSSLLLAENHIELGVGFISAKDNLTYIKEKKIISLASSPTKKKLIIPVLSLEYNGFFIASGDNVEGIGYRHDFDAFSFEVSYDSYEVFENPYLLNQNRKLVDAQELEFSISGDYAEFMEYSLSYKNIEIEDKVANDAQQSANEVSFDVNAVLLPLSKNAYMGLGYDFTYHNSKGKSNTHYKNGFSFFALTQLASDYSLVTEVAYADYKFNSKNSYFNKTRDEQEISIGAKFMIENLFIVDGYLKIELFYAKIDSNIDFFNKEYEGVTMGYGYKF